jgi:phage-related minor tail protein
MAREIDLLQSLIKEEERVNAIRDSIDQQNMGLLEQAEVLGMTTREATLYRMAMAGATEEQINFADSQLAVIERHEKLKGVIADLVTPLDEYADKLRTLDELYAAGEISLYSYQRAAEKYAKDLKDSTKSEFDELKQAIEGWGKSSSEAIVDFAMTGKTSFSDMIDSMISDILRMLVYQNITKPLATSISGFTGSVLSELGGDWSGMVFEQHGDAFSRGRILPYARGGVVDRPTIFPMAHGYGLMGEAGAEGILPLKRTASGDLGVQASGAGGAVTVNIINNAGAEVSQSSRETPRGMEIDVMIDAAVGKKLSTFGSQSNKAVRQNFGARETLVAR